MMPLGLWRVAEGNVNQADVGESLKCVEGRAKVNKVGKVVLFRFFLGGV